MVGKKSVKIKYANAFRLACRWYFGKVLCAHDVSPFKDGRGHVQIVTSAAAIPNGAQQPQKWTAPTSLST